MTDYVPRTQTHNVMAVQYTGDNVQEIETFTGRPGRLHSHFVINTKGEALVFDTLHTKWIKVNVGDYVVRGTRGEFFPYPPEDFERTYEQA